MDEFFLMAGLAIIAFLLIVVLVPYLFFSHLGLKSKVRDLDALVRRLQSDLTRLAKQGGEPEVAPRTVPKTTAKAAATLPDAQVSEPNPWPAAPTNPVEPPAKTAFSPAADDSQTPTAFVFKPDLIDNLTGWLRENWVLAIAAASLALAGVFMVQYGIENGLLTPFWRVMGALTFGAALVAGGEFIRRKTSDDGSQDGAQDGAGATEFLPSILSGAGIVVLYVAVFGARSLYGLIGPMTTFLGLGLVSTIALVLGWFYGPVLAAVGILGASLAPFITGSNSDNSWMVHYYLAMVAVVALGIDTVKRWAWISALGLIATLAGSTLLWFVKGADLHFLGGVLITTFAAFAIPERGLFPRQSGAAFLAAALTRGKRLPEFPTRLTFAMTIVATLAAMAVSLNANTGDTVWLGLYALTILLLATTLWTRDAPALYDHALIPAAALLVTIALEPTLYGPLANAFWDASIAVPVGEATPIETPIPATVWVLSALGALGTILMFARMQWALREDGPKIAPTFWAFTATVFAPATLLILEFLWSPGTVLGPYPWALVAIVMAALMTALATLTAKATDDDTPLRSGLFAVGALTLITLAVFLILTKSALTVALAVMVLGTAALDRRHALPPLTYFIQIAVAIITFRLVVWPGFDWALGWDYTNQSYDIAYFEVAFAFLATLGLLAAAWWLSRDRRTKTALVLESACWTILGVFLAVTLLRMAPREDATSHWVLGLMSTIWIALALNQIYRMQAGGKFMTVVRALVVAAYGLTALGTLGLLMTMSNPLLTYSARVVGPPVFDSLALAFLPLAAVFAVAAWKITQFGRKVQIGFILASTFFATLYIGMEIRRLWRGTNLAVPGFSDPELYTYTLAMLIASVGLLMFAFSRRSDILRKVAMAGVALTVAKVFLVDMSGLSGLIRVMSFMGLGLSLVGLAWLNRKMTAQWERGGAGG